MATPVTELEMVGRLVLATALGFVIGLEREAAGQSAGERTHGLVALGSAAFTLLSIAAFPGSDPARVAAGIVTGLGFLGAGTIVKGGADRTIQGLTTAAGIWAVGAVGVAIGSGSYMLGLGSALLIGLLLLSERLLRLGERFTRRRREG